MTRIELYFVTIYCHYIIVIYLIFENKCKYFDFHSNDDSTVLTKRFKQARAVMNPVIYIVNILFSFLINYFPK